MLSAVGKDAQRAAVALAEEVTIVETAIGLHDDIGHFQDVHAGQGLAGLQGGERRAKLPVRFRSQGVRHDDLLAGGFQEAVVEMARRIGPEFARAVVRQVLKDAPMHLTKMSDIEFALDWVQDEFGLPCGS